MLLLLVYEDDRRMPGASKSWGQKVGGEW